MTPELQHARSLASLTNALHQFAWVQGKRSRYWLPDGKPDIAKNRIYGKAAQKAAGAKSQPQQTQQQHPPVQQASHPHPHPKPQQGLIGRTVGAVRNRVEDAYGKLKDRYGPTAAGAITASGVAGLALPVPGGSLIAAAPALAVAEASHQIRRLVGGGEKTEGKRAEPKPGEDHKVAQAKHDVARDAYHAALNQPGIPQERLNWLHNRMTSAKLDLDAAAGPTTTARPATGIAPKAAPTPRAPAKPGQSHRTVDTSTTAPAAVKPSASIDLPSLRKQVDDGIESSAKTGWNYNFTKARAALQEAHKHIDTHAAKAKPGEVEKLARDVAGVKDVKDQADAVKVLKAWVSETHDLLSDQPNILEKRPRVQQHSERSAHIFAELTARTAGLLRLTSWMQSRSI